MNQELSKRRSPGRELAEIGVVFGAALIVLIMSFPVIAYLA
jgi:hypothetical protein